MAIENYWDVSTAHVTRATMTLIEEGDDRLPIIAVYKYGAFLYVPEVIENSLPHDLWVILYEAKKKMCPIVRLDSDGDLLEREELPRYDW